MNEQNQTRLCDRSAHLSRRTLLGGGAMAGCGSLMMSSLARSLARADELGVTDPAKPRNVILLWLEGGPSQYETFDPHAGTKYGGDVKAIDTTVKGLQLSELLPQTAEQMHLTSLVRSVTSKEGDHERAIYNVKTGFRPDPTLQHPSVGAILCQADDKGGDIPRHISIVPGQQPARGGYLGAAYDAFKIDDPAGPVPDIKTKVDDERFQKRLDDLYNVAESEFRRGRLAKMETDRTLHQTATKSAVRMMSSEQLDAFDVSQESKSTLAEFGDSAFGRGCLAASRLIEVGARCIEVTLGGWDSHAANHSLHESRCGILDPALASLLKRLEERDLLDSTLLVCGGEFGRTPKINPAAGRDHWPHGFSVLLAGAGIRRGSVFGGTSPDPKLDPDKPLDDVDLPVTVADIHATVISSLGLEPEIELQTPIGRPMKRSEGQPIAAIMDT
ncbi:DUF1501 domain-containing protein [Rubripirellula amarantea]|uniref:DUF1501 domain-containing protein n=1 Tax=Rubripirellula amarantea TaxID=2527999 RepID=A0A5C5WQ95_9BACT|nr:DUF1501 domain-containing protein [Rubripirellula amarantea]MDA8743606.1 DUF1501 domain-containing protein [Rubripirellula amarantea]TWT52445.1 hypothetical protein Pla22_00690 [Rubripirellula amarantea]